MTMHNDLPRDIRSQAPLWFGSVVLAAIAFSALLGHNGGVFVFLPLTLLFALPVAILYLPVVLALTRTKGRGIWIVIASGPVVGPAALCLFFLFQQLRGVDPQTIWHGDPLYGGAPFVMECASLVGLLSTAIYGISLKLVQRQATPA